MNVFLTGATGYIGSAVARTLRERGHQVVGLARSDDAAAKLVEQGMAFVRGGLTDTETLATAARDADAVIHTAASMDEHMGETDNAAVDAILAALVGSGKPFVYTSGVWVLGDTGDTVATEETPTQPPAMVAWRVDVENKVLAAKENGVRSVVIRPGMVYGRGGGFAMQFAVSAREKGEAAYVGTGENRWTTVHVDDLADLYALALEKAPAGTLLNAVAGESVKVLDIAEAASRAAGAGGKSAAITVEQARQFMGPVADAILMDQRASSEKAKTLLGWQPSQPSIVDDLEETDYAG